ncbi:MAG TPA: MoaD/ThiS family protein [Candidatus Sulfotelmatobacter sp.]|nr:MoaD/ThiS family protein [Candidatus Sulfotelmatobacter sp.]
MSVTVYIPGMLRPRCEGARHLTVEAASVRLALAEIERRFPQLYLGICEETGAVRRHVNLFVNVTNVRDLDGVETALASGDELTILPSVSGG